MAYKRDYKKEYENYDGTEKVKKRRAARNKARRFLEREGRVHKGDGKDVDHRDGNPHNNEQVQPPGYGRLGVIEAGNTIELN
jgi:hypothetical protein